MVARTARYRFIMAGIAVLVASKPLRVSLPGKLIAFDEYLHSRVRAHSSNSRYGQMCIRAAAARPLNLRGFL